eukprot:CAMPEP_0115031556 /NCGR_PEP_ID=MMETSP0216-20121206/38613_1 /TAXON_ID=223996 /ORGANISM="Protocruzia adherens, Strain Boccale" /LENGTH=191 /DNA_ID=CAMNT_0002409247 /DNA_START=113 /DNA_END=688 /DNA_ORIENTATION=+
MASLTTLHFSPENWEKIKTQEKSSKVDPETPNPTPKGKGTNAQDWDSMTDCPTDGSQRSSFVQGTPSGAASARSSATKNRDLVMMSVRFPILTTFIEDDEAREEMARGSSTTGRDSNSCDWANFFEESPSDFCSLDQQSDSEGGGPWRYIVFDEIPETDGEDYSEQIEMNDICRNQTASVTNSISESYLQG